MHHPPGEALANDRMRGTCWGCGNPRPKETEMDFKPGDIVRLKSGGPSMTVDEVEKKGNVTSIFCFWFDGAQLEDGEFSPTSLMPVADAPVAAPAPAEATP